MLEKIRYLRSGFLRTRLGSARRGASCKRAARRGSAIHKRLCLECLEERTVLSLVLGQGLEGIDSNSAGGWRPPDTNSAYGRFLLLAEPLRGELIAHFKSIGYTYVTMDLQGFRSGSMNPEGA